MHVVLSLAPGGTERLVIEIVRRCRLQAVDSVICCLDEPGAWAEELIESGIPVVTLGRRPGFTPRLARSIASLISNFGVRVIHCHHYSPFVYGQLGALLTGGVDVVFTEHGRLSDARPSIKRRLVNPLLGRLPAAIYAVSEDLRRHMLSEGMPASRVQVLRNGIDAGPEPTADARRAARNALALPSSALVIGTIARLDPVKDLRTLLEAFAHLHRTIPDSHLVIIGDGPERASLEEAAAAAALRNAVQFTGLRQDARSLLPAFDIFANSSIHEGISLTILEAMAAELAVVATNVGGTPEVVDAEVGTLVPSRSPRELSLALAAMAADPDRRMRMGAAARLRVKSAFSIERMVAQYVAAYRGRAAADSDAGITPRSAASLARDDATNSAPPARSA